jgi:hypothetical protein
MMRFIERIFFSFVMAASLAIFAALLIVLAAAAMQHWLGFAGIVAFLAVWAACFVAWEKDERRSADTKEAR